MRIIENNKPAIINGEVQPSLPPISSDIIRAITAKNIRKDPTISNPW